MKEGKPNYDTKEIGDRRMLRQKRIVLLCYTLIPLVLLSVAVIGFFYSFHRKLDRLVEMHAAEIADTLAAVSPVRRTDWQAYPDKVLALYYDADGVRIDDPEYGSELSPDAAQQLEKLPEEQMRASDLRIGTGDEFRRYAVQIRAMHAPNALGAQTLVVLYDMTLEMRAYHRAIGDGIAIFVAIFSLQVLLVFVVERLQIKPYLRASERQKQLVLDLSHEYNTPLAVAGSVLGELMARPDATVEEMSERLATVAEELNRLKRLTKNMLLLSRSDSGVAQIEARDCDLSEWVRETAEPFGLMAQMDGKRMLTEIESNVRMRTDPDKIRQCVTALLDNALKYTQSGDTITVRVAKEKDKIVIAVSDTGRGVQVEPLERIFERFYREDASRSVGGSGLGLAIVRTTVLQLDGKVHAFRNAPKGLRVVMEWSAARVAKRRRRREDDPNGDAER